MDTPYCKAVFSNIGSNIHRRVSLLLKRYINRSDVQPTIRAVPSPLPPTRSIKLSSRAELNGRPRLWRVNKLEDRLKKYQIRPCKWVKSLLATHSRLRYAYKRDGGVLSSRLAVALEVRSTVQPVNGISCKSYWEERDSM